MAFAHLDTDVVSKPAMPAVTAGFLRNLLRDNPEVGTVGRDAVPCENVVRRG